jgi:hypothetical protein
VIAFFLAAWLAASPTPLDYVVTDREGHTWVGSTSEPDADPLVLQTPNGPMSIPRADLASTHPVTIPQEFPHLKWVCGCPSLGKIEPSPEFFSILVGTGAVFSVRIRDRWIAEADQALVPYIAKNRFASGGFAGYAVKLWDRRERGGTSTWELPLELGYRDAPMGLEPVRYRGVAGRIGLNYTWWLATRPGVRLQFLVGENQWLGSRPWFSPRDSGEHGGPPIGDLYQYRLPALSPEYRLAAGFVF